MFCKRFWRLSLERAVKTFAQTLLAILGVGGLGLLDAPWVTALSTAGMATLLSLLSSVTSMQVGDPTNPSMIPELRAIQGSPRVASI
jgi:hypothetical protein